MSNFLHDADNDTKAIPILRLFSENSRGKNLTFSVPFKFSSANALKSDKA